MAHAKSDNKHWGSFKVNSFELSSSFGICQYALLAFNFVKNFVFNICAKISSAVGIMKCGCLIA